MHTLFCAELHPISSILMIDSINIVLCADAHGLVEWSPFESDLSAIVAAQGKRVLRATALAHGTVCTDTCAVLRRFASDLLSTVIE